jgi:hypothetical protein
MTTYPGSNPNGGRLLKAFMELVHTQQETARQTAATCFEIAPFKTLAEREAVVAEAVALMRSRIDHYARATTLEVDSLMRLPGQQR